MADTQQTKTIGEYWVCSALARRRWAPALTRDGLERTDILAVRTSGLTWLTPKQFSRAQHRDQR